MGVKKESAHLAAEENRIQQVARNHSNGKHEDATASQERSSTQNEESDSADKSEPPNPAQPKHFMYVLSCADGTLYTGYTTNVEQRVRTHNAAKGAKYTRSRLPVELVAQVQFDTKQEAMSAEYRFKRLSRSQKDALLKEGLLPAKMAGEIKS